MSTIEDKLASDIIDGMSIEEKIKIDEGKIADEASLDAQRDNIVDLEKLKSELFLFEKIWKTKPIKTAVWTMYDRWGDMNTSKFNTGLSSVYWGTPYSNRIGSAELLAKIKELKEEVLQKEYDIKKASAHSLVDSKRKQYLDNLWSFEDYKKALAEPEEEVVNIINKDAEADNNKEEKEEEKDKILHSGTIKPINTNKSDEDKKKAAAAFSQEWYDKLTSDKFNKSEMVQNNSEWNTKSLATKLKAYLTNLNAEKTRKNNEEAGSASKDEDFMKQIAASTAEAKREFGDDFAADVIKSLNN